MAKAIATLENESDKKSAKSGRIQMALLLVSAD